jgi:Uma2 family endonuclease
MSTGVPRLRNGDHLTRDEFLRRYGAMPNVRHAELIEGRVIMPSPVSAAQHGEPHFDLNGWLFLYRAMTPGVIGGDNSTLNLDLDNAPQPDGYLRLTEARGGQSRMVDGYLSGAPELVVEIAASSVSYDLHDKLNAYRRNGVREYVVWRTEDVAIDWFQLVEGRFDRMATGDDGVYRSQVFPGLWLDSAAVIRGDLASVLKTLYEGLASESHQTFVGFEVR